MQLGIWLFLLRCSLINGLSTGYSPAIQRQDPWNIIWQYKNVAMEEYYWTRVLLSATGRPVRLFTDTQRQLVLNDSIVFFDFAGGDLDSTAYFSAARAAGYVNLAMFVAGDEQNEKSKKNYDPKLVDFVVRNYYFASNHDGHFGLPVLWAPNGYRTGVGPMKYPLPVHLRQFAVSWFGSLRADRRHIITTVRDNLAAANISFDIVVFDNFGGGLSPFEYSGRVENSQFCLVPAGNSFETIRLYDCLETGTIPIVPRAPYLSQMHGHPFVVVESRDWLSVAGIVAGFLADPVRLASKQRAVMDFWRDFQARKAEEIRDVVDAAFLKAHGRA